jgi:predicted GNAT family acetyltransferase
MTDEPGTIRVTEKKELHRYEAYVDGVLAGFVAYRLIPGGIVFVHTKTEPAFEGMGVGSRLARVALDDARARGLRVTPLCPFVAAYIERHPDYADLVDQRA